MSQIGIIGYGNIGEAMVSGLLKSGIVRPGQILVSSRNEKKINRALEEFKIGVTRNNLEVVKFSDILVIAVKPFAMAGVLEEIKDSLKDETVLISVVSSVDIKEIKAVVGDHKVIRAMLNTPVMVNEGMIALAIGEDVSFLEEETAIELFKSFGKTRKNLS